MIISRRKDVSHIKGNAGFEIIQNFNALGPVITSTVNEEQESLW